MFEKIRWFLATQIRKILVIAIGITGIFFSFLIGCGYCALLICQGFFKLNKDFVDEMDTIIEQKISKLDENFSTLLLKVYTLFGFKIYKIDITQNNDYLKHRIKIIKEYQTSCFISSFIYYNKNDAYLKMSAISEEDRYFLKLVSPDFF